MLIRHSGINLLPRKKKRLSVFKFSSLNGRKVIIRGESIGSGSRFAQSSAGILSNTDSLVIPSRKVITKFHGLFIGFSVGRSILISDTSLCQADAAGGANTFMSRGVHLF